MIIQCEDNTPIKNLTPKSRKKIIFKCDNCGKESSRVYRNYYNNEINLCRSCMAKKINNNPEVKKKNSEKQKERWKYTNKEEIGNKISNAQKKSWKNGRKGKRKSLSYEKVKKSFEDEGYTFLINENEYYNTPNLKMKYKCPKGHIGYTDYNHWFIRKQRCGKCSKNAPLSYYNVKSSFEERGYELVTTKEEFRGTSEDLKYKCPYGHYGSITWTHWLRGHGCSKCAKNQKIKLENVKESIELDNYIFLGENIKNSKDFFEVECSKGHRFKTCWNYWNAGQRCPQCASEMTSSKAEKEIGDIIENMGFDIIRNDRSLLGNLELDIYIESKKLAIEYCGIYWHSEKFKDKNYHINKLKRCREIGIDLITIFEDEWINKRDIVESRLKHILGKSEDVIYARNCEVKEIESKIAKKFCENYHIQGYQPSKVKLDLLYNNQIVSVMTFGKQSAAKGKSNSIEGEWEIIRFCSRYNVVGAAGKLLSYFKKNFEWNKIITFADRRWSKGNLYEKLGFSFVGYTKPNYWYINMNSDNLKREHRYTYRKNKISHLGEGTEWDIMKSLGYTRIWDCGHIKFQLVK